MAKRQTEEAIQNNQPR